MRTPSRSWVTKRLRSGQAMIETVIAVLVISFIFIALFKLSYLLNGKILLEHAAMRVARARAVGLNDYMCLKAARVAVIPVSGRRTWPVGEDALDWDMELNRIPEYMYCENDSYARAILDYEAWPTLRVSAGDGTDSRVSLGFSILDDNDSIRLEGRGGVEANASLYMSDMGL